MTDSAFQARHARAEYVDEADIDLVGVSEDRDGSGRVLLLQRERSVSPRDRALGLDEVAITAADTATVYGGVTGYTVTEQELILELTAEGADTLGLPAQARIGLALSDEELAELKAGLLLVFGAAI